MVILVPYYAFFKETEFNGVVEKQLDSVPDYVSGDGHLGLSADSAMLQSTCGHLWTPHPPLVVPVVPRPTTRSSLTRSLSISHTNPFGLAVPYLLNSGQART